MTTNAQAPDVKADELRFVFSFVEIENMGAENQAADEAQFESGYTQDPTATPGQDVKPEAPVEEIKAPEPAIDPIKALEDRIARFEKGHTTLAGQFGGMMRSQKEIQDTLAAAHAATSHVKDAPTQAAIKEAMTSPKEWDDLKNDFPEWATATEKYMDARLSNRPQGLDEAALEKRLKDVEARVINTSLNAVFPGWRADTQNPDGTPNPEFAAWATAQPPDIQALANSDEVADAARMLKLYYMRKEVKPEPKAEPKPEVSTRQRRIEAAITPRGTGGHAPGRTEEDEFEAGYNSR